jgi:hypothetical protein
MALSKTAIPQRFKLKKKEEKKDVQYSEAVLDLPNNIRNHNNYIIF